MTWLGQVILDEAPGEGSHHPPHARVVASYLGGLDLCNGRYDTVRANLWTAAGAMCAPRHMQCRKCAGTATLIIISSNTTSCAGHPLLVPHPGHRAFGRRAPAVHPRS